MRQSIEDQTGNQTSIPEYLLDSINGLNVVDYTGFLHIKYNRHCTHFCLRKEKSVRMLE